MSFICSVLNKRILSRKELSWFLDMGIDRVLICFNNGESGFR